MKSMGVTIRDTTTCVLNLPTVSVQSTDVVRVVYACHDTEEEAEGWKWTKEVDEIRYLTVNG